MQGPQTRRVAIEDDAGGYSTGVELSHEDVGTDDEREPDFTVELEDWIRERDTLDAPPERDDENDFRQTPEEAYGLDPEGWE